MGAPCRRETFDPKAGGRGRRWPFPRWRLRAARAQPALGSCAQRIIWNTRPAPQEGQALEIERGCSNSIDASRPFGGFANTGAGEVSGALVSMLLSWRIWL